MTPADLIRIARTWVGAPWVHQGRAPAGCDCIGLGAGVLAEAGIDVDYARDYKHRPRNDELLRRMREFGIFDEVREPAPGDILVFTIKGEPQHIAILTERETIVHALIGHGVRETAFGDMWRRRLVAVMRLRDPDSARRSV